MSNNEYKLATINLRHFLEECSNNIEAYSDFGDCIKYYMARQKRVGGYYKFNEDFSTTVNCYGDKDNILLNFKFNYDEFISKLIKILNVNVNELDEYGLLRLFEKRLRKLKEIEDKIDLEEELKKEFPLIYEDYNNGYNLYKSFTIVFDFLDEEDNKLLSEAKKNKKYYYDCGLRFHLPYFIKEQYTLYNNLIHGLDYIKDYIDHNSLLASKDFSIDENINKEKMKLYLINEYIEEALKCNDIELKKVYLSLVNNYLINNKDSDISIHDINGNEIGYEDITLKFKEFINLNKELKEYLVDWVLIPEGDLYNYIDSSETVKKEKKSDSNSELLDSGHIEVNPDLEKYIILNNRKLSFYEGNSHNRELCLAKAIGLFLNKGYIAYIYKNGEILLDVIAKEKNIKSAYGNAIYNLNVYNFETLSKLDKITLRSKKLCPIIPHTKNWEKVAQKIIDKEVLEDGNEAAKRLVKRIQDNTI